MKNSTLIIEGFEVEKLNHYASVIDACEGKLDIYLASQGGGVSSADFLTRKINNIPDTIDVTVYVSFAASSAISLLRNLTKKIELLEWAFWIYHCEAWDISIATCNSWRWAYANFQLSTMPKEIKPLPWLDKEQNEEYTKWNDVYFNTHQLADMLMLT